MLKQKETSVSSLGWKTLSENIAFYQEQANLHTRSNMENEKNAKNILENSIVIDIDYWECWGLKQINLTLAKMDLKQNRGRSRTSHNQL